MMRDMYLVPLVAIAMLALAGITCEAMHEERAEHARPTCEEMREQLTAQAREGMRAVCQ
jgi:sRNA-binding protein